MPSLKLAAVIALLAIVAVAAATIVVFKPLEKPQLQLSISPPSATLKLAPGESSSLKLVLKGCGSGSLAIYIFDSEAVSERYGEIEGYLSGGEEVPQALMEELLPNSLQLAVKPRLLSVQGDFEEPVFIEVAASQDAAPATYKLEIWVVEIGSKPLHVFKANLTVEILKATPPELHAAPLNISAYTSEWKFSLHSNSSTAAFPIPGDAALQVDLHIESVEALGSPPSIKVTISAVINGREQPILLDSIDMKNLKLPYTHCYPPFSVANASELKVNITAISCTVKGHVEFLAVPYVQVDPGIYLVHSSAKLVAVEVPIADSKPLLVEKNPPGGSLYTFSREALEDSNVVFSFSISQGWCPTGIIPSYGFHRAILPLYTTSWGGFTYNNTTYQMGWLHRELASSRQNTSTALILLDLGNTTKTFTLKIEPTPYPCTPEEAQELKVGQAVALVEAEHAEGILFKVNVDKAPAALTLKFTLDKPVDHSMVWVACTVLDPSFKIPEKNVHAKAVSTSPLEILYNSLTMKLPVEKPGTYLICFNYQVLSPEKQLGLKVKLVDVKPVNLEEFEYDEDYNVWRAEVYLE